MQTIIWDWNGTLLNDLDLCISTINRLLRKRGLPLLNPTTYKERFSFPVKNYYEKIGFDFSKEDFAIPAREFIELYNRSVTQCTLHSGTHKVLSLIKHRGIRQIVLSAMQETMLERTLKDQQIFDYFEHIAGLSDHYAHSKIERGKELFKQLKIDKAQTTMIGDTIHDFEVAEELGINCILVANGHQSARRLQQTQAPVIENLGELLKNVALFDVANK